MRRASEGGKENSPELLVRDGSLSHGGQGDETNGGLHVGGVKCGWRGDECWKWIDGGGCWLDGCLVVISDASVRCWSKIDGGCGEKKRGREEGEREAFEGRRSTSR